VQQAWRVVERERSEPIGVGWENTHAAAGVWSRLHHDLRRPGNEDEASRTRAAAGMESYRITGVHAGVSFVHPAGDNWLSFDSRDVS